MKAQRSQRVAQGMKNSCPPSIKMSIGTGFGFAKASR